MIKRYLCGMTRMPYIKRTTALQIVLVIFVVLILFILYGHTEAWLKNQYDDAYITYRYAMHLANGHGLVFNPGDRTEAVSTLFYTLLLALAYKVGIVDLEAVGAVIGILSTLGISLLTYKSVERITRRSWLPFFCGALVGVHGFISGWAISGMETVLFTFLVTAFLYAYFIQENTNKKSVTALMILVLLTRMEGLLLLAIWGVAEVHRVVSVEGKWKPFFIQAAIFAGVVLTLFATRYAYYGTFLASHAVQFKKIAVYYQPNPWMLAQIWGGSSLVLMVLALPALWTQKTKRLRFLCLYILLSAISFVLGPHSDGGRYSVHVFPALFIFASLTLDKMERKGDQGENKTLAHDPTRRIVLTLVCVLLAAQTVLSAIVVRSFMVTLVQHQICRKEVGAYISGTLQKGDYVLSGDIGAIAYTAKDLKFIDISGLTSRDVLSHYQRKITLDDIVREKKPKVLADSFFIDASGNLQHPLLTNQVEHIMGMHQYSTLFSPALFVHPLFQCKDGPRVFAVIDLASLYH